jgi:hypothetical protein
VTCEPATNLEWSRRALINVADVLSDHLDAFTLIGGHAVHLHTESLDIPHLPTVDGDLLVSPATLEAEPHLGQILRAAGYAPRTPHRPGLWGRGEFRNRFGKPDWREKIDLMAPRAFSGTTSKTRRSVPATASQHGIETVGNTTGLELGVFDRAERNLVDFADPTRQVSMYVAGCPSLIVAKSFKIYDRLTSRKNMTSIDKDVADLWRLLAVSEPAETIDFFRLHAKEKLVAESIRAGVLALIDILDDPANAERAVFSFGSVLSSGEVTNTFQGWSSELRHFMSTG